MLAFRFRCTGAIAAMFVVCGLLRAEVPSNSASDLPRYRLQVGQELVYKGESIFRYEGGAHGTRDSWNVWVVRENPDGSWRLVIRSGNAFGSAREARRPVTGETGTLDKLLDLFKQTADVATGAAEVQFDGPENVTFAWCDFHPDGRIVENDSFGFRMRLSGLLPRLPASAEEAKGEWLARNERMDDALRLKYAPTGSAGVLKLEYVLESPMNEIYGSENKGVITFDVALGRPTGIESTTTQTYGFDGKGTGTVKFVEEQTHPADWLAKFVAETDQYFAAQAQYEQATSRRDLTQDELKASLDGGIANLKAAAAAIELPELKTVIQEQIANSERMNEYRLEEAAERLAVLGKPSEEWMTVDIAGEPRSLVDYRGKVVVLDFWYRGCGWCIRAMPQIKEVVTHYERRPVAVIGMNTDRKEEDAQFVIDKMGLNYATLKATGLPEKYNVRGFPTLVILDQEGVIRDFHVGYSPTLKKDVIESIDKLLATPPSP